MRNLRTFELFESKSDNIWYHITTVEALPKIKSSGGLDPKKSLNDEVLFWRPKRGQSVLQYAEAILKFPAWVIRDTVGYLLLSVDLTGLYNFDHPAKGDTIRSTSKMGAMVAVKVLISSDRIVEQQGLHKPKYETVGIFSKDGKSVSIYKFDFNTEETGNSFYEVNAKYVNYVVSSSKNNILPKSLISDSFHAADEIQVRNIITWLDNNGFKKVKKDPNLAATFVDKTLMK